MVRFAPLAQKSRPSIECFSLFINEKKRIFNPKDAYNFELEKTIDEIHKLGIKAGLACNPETPVDDIVPYINKVDMILIMTVHPGFGGQSYIDECTEKVEIVNAIVNEYRLDTLIQVDGGVNTENVCIPLDAGANVIVAGSAVYKGDVEKNIEVFKNKFISFE